jgi:hypothetical protein
VMARSTESAPADGDANGDENEADALIHYSAKGVSTRCGGDAQVLLVSADSKQVTCEDCLDDLVTPEEEMESGLDIPSKPQGGIKGNLLQLVEDEGYQSAIEVAEEWRNNLEAMLECANDDEQKMLRPMHKLMQETIQAMLAKLNEMGQK